MYNKQLETFLCAAETGSFSKAAKELYLSTSGVIKQIYLLEQHLGFSLFTRSPQGIFLTPAGQSIYQDAKEMIRFSEEAVARAQNVMNNYDRQIHIVVPTDVPAKYVQRVWPKLLESCRNYELVFENYGLGLEHADQIYLDLGSKVDLVMSSYDEGSIQRRGMAAQKLLDVNICCMVPLLHRLSGREQMEVADLAGETVLMVEVGVYPNYDKIRERLKEHGQIAVEDVLSYDTRAYNQCINEGKILIAPDAEVPGMIKAIPLQGCTTPFGLYHFSPSTERVKSFLEQLKNVSF